MKRKKTRKKSIVPSFSVWCGVGLVHQAKQVEEECVIASMHAQSLSLSHGAYYPPRGYFSTAVSNNVMRGDIVPQKTETANIGTNMWNKRCGDWLAVGYEGETFLKCVAHLANQGNLLRFFGYIQDLLDT